MLSVPFDRDLVTPVALLPLSRALRRLFVRGLGTLAATGLGVFGLWFECVKGLSGCIGWVRAIVIG